MTSVREPGWAERSGETRVEGTSVALILPCLLVQ